MRTMTAAMATAIVTATMAAPVLAAPDPAALQRCVGIASDSERLACFDEAMASSSAEARRLADERKRTAEEAARRKAAEDAKAQERAFGAEGIDSAARREEVQLPREDMERLDTTVTEQLVDSLGRSIIVLANGQMWRQVSGMSLPTVRPGDEAKIEKGFPSGYRMTIKRLKRTVPVRRMR